MALKKSSKVKPVNNHLLLIVLSIFQIITSLLSATAKGEFEAKVVISMLVLIAVEWVYLLIFHAFFRRRNFELEMIAFFLSGTGIAIIGSIDPSAAFKQLIMVLAGIFAFIIMVELLRHVDLCMKLRTPVAIIAVGFLVVNIILAKIMGTINGAYNWIEIAGFKLQPSEFVKIAFIFVGSATLEKIQTSKNHILFFGFSIFIVLSLAIIRDFGTLFIFFVTFLILSFMNYGDMKIVLAAVGAAGAGGALVLKLKPYVMNRFQAWRHVWEFSDTTGFQQSRVLIGMASGGLFGVGIGNGYVRNIYASTNDAIFGVICEEWGFVFAVALVLSFVFIAISALTNSVASRSAFYSIGAVAAAGLLLFQCALNIFGITDLLPLTGVTIPFVSQGGSSMLSCWAMLSFIKAADVRTYNRLGGKKKR